MAKVPNGVERLPKISIAWVGCTNVTDYRRQTDGRTTTHSDPFMFANNTGTFLDKTNTSSCVEVTNAWWELKYQTETLKHFKCEARKHLVET